jgi:hypothetical protein
LLQEKAIKVSFLALNCRRELERVASGTSKQEALRRALKATIDQSDGEVVAEMIFDAFTDDIVVRMLRRTTCGTRSRLRNCVSAEASEPNPRPFRFHRLSFLAV